jgi:ribose transport system permease protein
MARTMSSRKRTNCGVAAKERNEFTTIEAVGNRFDRLKRLSTTGQVMSKSERTAQQRAAHWSRFSHWRSAPVSAIVTRTGLEMLRAPMVPVLVFTLLLFILTVPGFTSSANLVNMAQFFAPLSIAAIGIMFVFLIGGIDLSIGSTLSLASVFAAVIMRDSGSVVAGAVAGIGAGLAVGALNGTATAVLGIPPFVHTFGMLLTLRATALLMTAGHSVGRLPIFALQLGRGAILGVSNLLWMAALVSVAAHLLLSRTVLGREMFLIGTNERAAIFSGLRVPLVKFTAYLLCGGLAGLSGVTVVLRLGSGGPVLGDNLLLMAIAAVVLGGNSIVGGDVSVFRTLTGAAVIILLDKGLNLLGLSFFDQAIVIGAVIVVGSALSTWIHRQTSARA